MDIMHYQRINRVLRSARVNIMLNMGVPMSAFIYGKNGEFAITCINESNLSYEHSRIKVLERALNAEQTLFVWSGDNNFLPCFEDESMGKEAIKLFSILDGKIEEVISNPFQRLDPNNVTFGKNYHYCITDNVFHLIGETESDFEFNSDMENDFISPEALMD